MQLESAPASAAPGPKIFLQTCFFFFQYMVFCCQRLSASFPFFFRSSFTASTNPCTIPISSTCCWLDRHRHCSAITSAIPSVCCPNRIWSLEIPASRKAVSMSGWRFPPHLVPSRKYTVATPQYPLPAAPASVLPVPGPASPVLRSAHCFPFFSAFSKHRPLLLV